MQKWYHIIPEKTGLSLYIWIVFCILPFYFIFTFSSSPLEFASGVFMILMFYTSYWMSFSSQGWPVFVWVSIEIAISIAMILYFGFVYFGLFLAIFIGRIGNKAGFLALYIVHLLTTLAAVTGMFWIQSEIVTSQLPFILLSVIGVILLPFTINYRMKREKLEGQLEEANERISNLMVMEERQRIARDLHDTLGQKLSLIGLKSDLAYKMMDKNLEKARTEIEDIHYTARTALKEVREMVSDMKGLRLNDEIIYIRQILEAAEIEYRISGDAEFTDTLIENVLSMCLKEAVTNVVKHSQASFCNIIIDQRENETVIKVADDGIGMPGQKKLSSGHGLQGMRERLEFVNGNIDWVSTNGTTLTIRVPHVIQHTQEGDS